MERRKGDESYQNADSKLGAEGIIPGELLGIVVQTVSSD
jgi:hypothetical protein